MGDISDMHDLDRFMRSKEGKQRLRELAKALKGKVITEVCFSNEISAVALTLHLADGNIFQVFLPKLGIEALRDDYAEVLDREYYRDFPERKTS